MVRTRAHLEGPECVRWLSDLDALAIELSHEWGIVVGSPMTGGTASFVAQATLAEGTPAVLKLVMPSGQEGRDALVHEVTMLRHADGRGCVRVLAYDRERGAVLLERLGRQLSEVPIPAREQMEIICDALRELWSVPVGEVDLPHLDAKGHWLARCAIDLWEELGHPCERRTIDLAVEYAEGRSAAFDLEGAVLVHGDAHVWNTLQDTAVPRRFRLIDADGLIGEPEYDLAIIMREFTDELVAGDALAIGLERARFLAELTGLDEQRIWEWGYVERVTTGLLCLKHEMTEATGFLAVADAWSQISAAGA